MNSANQLLNLFPLHPLPLEIWLCGCPLLLELLQSVINPIRLYLGSIILSTKAIPINMEVSNVLPNQPYLSKSNMRWEDPVLAENGTGLFFIDPQMQSLVC